MMSQLPLYILLVLSLISTYTIGKKFDRLLEQTRPIRYQYITEHYSVFPLQLDLDIQFAHQWELVQIGYTHDGIPTERFFAIYRKPSNN